jgi:hypothetical protein
MILPTAEPAHCKFVQSRRSSLVESANRTEVGSEPKVAPEIMFEVAVFANSV